MALRRSFYGETRRSTSDYAKQSFAKQRHSSWQRHGFVGYPKNAFIHGHARGFLRRRVNYGYNDYLYTYAPGKVDRSGRADQLVTFVDCLTRNVTGRSDSWAWWNPDEAHSGYGVQFAHNGGANLLFWDGHVLWATKETIATQNASSGYAHDYNYWFRLP